MRPRRMRVLVIGAAGMLGGKLVDRLVREGARAGRGRLRRRHVIRGRTIGAGDDRDGRAVAAGGTDRV